MTPIEPDEAWLDSIRQDTALAWQWVDTFMSIECLHALERFVATNPGQRGIEWWDALDMLRDADAHLDIIEPLVERCTPGTWGALHTYVTLTLIYSVKDFTQRWDDDQRFIAMRATIENNSRLAR